MKSRFKTTLQLVVMTICLLSLFSLAAAAPAQTIRNSETAAAPEGAGSTLHLPYLTDRGPGKVQSLFGIQMYGATSANSFYHPYMIETNASWVRAPILWRIIEGTPDTYAWGHGDLVTGAAQDVTFIATLADAPEWVAEDMDGPLDSAGMDQMAEFAHDVAERYDGDGFMDAFGHPVVNYFEIFNEPDRGVGSWGHVGEDYAELLSRVTPAIKAANPNAKVLIGGIAYDFFEDQGGAFVREFIDDVLNAGGGEYFDIMNFHAYSLFAFNWAPQGLGLREKTFAIRSKLVQHGYGDMPIFVTEAGTHSNIVPDYPSSQERQSRYVVELFVQSASADVEMMIWWMLHDTQDQYQTGLITGHTPPVKKLAFTAFRQITQILSGADYVRKMTNAQTGASIMEAYVFRNDVTKKTIYVAWLNPVDSIEVRSLRVPGEQATVKNIYGIGTIVTDNGDGANDGHVRVNVSGQPVYIEVID